MHNGKQKGENRSLFKPLIFLNEDKLVATLEQQTTCDNWKKNSSRDGLTDTWVHFD